MISHLAHENFASKKNPRNRNVGLTALHVVTKEAVQLVKSTVLVFAVSRTPTKTTTESTMAEKLVCD